MNARQVLVSFRGCRTRAAALARFEAFLAAHCDDMVKQIASQWTVEHDDAENQADFLTDLEALRHALALQRPAAVASFLAALDTARADIEAERCACSRAGMCCRSW